MVQANLFPNMCFSNPNSQKGKMSLKKNTKMQSKTYSHKKANLYLSLKSGYLSKPVKDD